MNDPLQKHQDALQQALAENSKIGGSRMVEYAGLQVLVPVRDIHHAYDKFLTMGDRYRKDVMQSVTRSLNDKLPHVSAITASSQVAMQCGQDIAIWFANEVIEGRATLEIH